jgi:hypothetical protein
MRYCLAYQYPPPEPQYQRSSHTNLNKDTSDARQIINIVKWLLKEIYKTGYRYQKCSVQLGGCPRTGLLKRLSDYPVITRLQWNELAMVKCQ